MLKLLAPRLGDLVIAICLSGGVALPAAAADLRIGFNAEVSSADPQVHQTQNRNVWLHVYEPLVKQDAQLRATPCLARSWRAVDPLTWSFTLRPDVKFHDGSPFTAEDAKFSIERARSLGGPRTLKSYLKGIESVTVVDPLTLQIKTSGPSPSLPDNLSLVVIVPHGIGKAANEESFSNGKSAIGTGPYKLGEWVRGQRVVLTRNDAYWGGREPWDKVIFEFILKDPARAAALLSGSVDVINGASAVTVESLERSNRFEHVSATSYMLNYLYFDRRAVSPYVTDFNSKPLAANPFNNIKVRQAMSLAINRDVIVRNVMKGDAEPASQPVPAGFFGHDPSIKPAAPDVARAKALLAEAGYPQGFRVVMHCPNDRYLNDAKVCEGVAQMLTQVGIKAEVQTLPFAVLQTRSIGTAKVDPEFSLSLRGIGAVSGDSLQPLLAIAQSYDAKKGTGANNYGRYSNPEIDALLDKAGSTMPPAEREELQRKAARLFAEDSGGIFLHHLKASWAARKGLKVTPRSDGFIFATGVREAGAK